MIVKELKEILNCYSDDLEVWVLCPGYGNAFPAKQEDVKISKEREYSNEEYKSVLLLGQE